MSTFEALQLLIDFAELIIAILTFVVALILFKDKK